MAQPHPCCHLMPTQLGAKFIACCDLIFGLIGMFWFIYLVNGYGEPVSDDEAYNEATQTRRVRPLLAVLQPNISEKILQTITEPTVTETERFPTLTIFSEDIYVNSDIGNIILSGINTFMNLTLGFLLLNAVNTRNILKLKVWFVVRTITILFKFIMYQLYISSGFKLDSQMPHVVFTAVHLYGLWIVGELIREIKREGSERQSPAPAFAINKHFSTNEQ
ncbi:hypothetical protein Ocin01_10080 [Orchesella cincta]|uniref:Uncharacterized protein n=1 Tax=Orchesella cincta TaxID=48709 RepID=A0A1D2MU42_ORCCI|nr:hypothetical protein Ocin01_10080 [Orchesella cincta]